MKLELRQSFALTLAPLQTVRRYYYGGGWLERNGLLKAFILLLVEVKVQNSAVSGDPGNRFAATDDDDDDDGGGTEYSRSPISSALTRCRRGRAYILNPV